MRRSESFDQNDPSDSLVNLNVKTPAIAMISAIVLVPDVGAGSDLAHERETVVRSLVWLVSAVVSSVVRDVTLAVPPGLGLSQLADQSGCALVQADTESERLNAALAATRAHRLILIRAGFQPESGLVDEIDIFIRREPEEAIAVLQGLPTTIVQRVLPARAPVVGIILPRRVAEEQGAFDRLARHARRNGILLKSRARPIP